MQGPSLQFMHVYFTRFSSTFVQTKYLVLLVLTVRNQGLGRRIQCIIIFGFTFKEEIKYYQGSVDLPGPGWWWWRRLTELRLLANDLRNFTSFLFTTLNLYLVKKTLANI